MIPAARIVPDVASFSVDNGFWYSIPDHLRHDLQVGSIVRVPLSGRRVRGWVVDTAPDREGKLKDIAGISGSRPVFDRDLLKTLVWTAHHYVAPVSTLLGRASPPNLPRSTPKPSTVPSVPFGHHPISQAVARSASGDRAPVVALVGNWRRLTWLEELGPLFESGRSALVVAATAAEVGDIAARAGSIWGDLVVSADGEDDRIDTEAWEAAQSAPRLIVGTPKIASWMVGELGLAIGLE